MKRGLLVVLVISLFLISGCASKVAEKVAIPLESNQISINHFVFEPKEIIINAGDTVTWTHNNTLVHIVVSQDLFESKKLNNGNKTTFTFTKPGEYIYYCSIHPSMKGKVIVK